MAITNTMKVQYYVRMRAMVTIDDELLDVILQSSEHHYDSRVKSMCRQKNQDGDYREAGLLYSARMWRKHFKEQPSSDPDFDPNAMDLAFSDIDLMCKALEMDQTGKGMAITMALHKILRTFKDNEDIINKALVISPEKLFGILNPQS